MCVRESFSEHADTLILATDIDTTVLARASSGLYRHDQVSGVSPARLNRFFEKTKDGRDTSYCVKKCLSEIVKFGRLNFSGPSVAHLTGVSDIIFCRKCDDLFQSANAVETGRTIRHTHQSRWLFDHWSLGITARRIGYL